MVPVQMLSFSNTPRARPQTTLLLEHLSSCNCEKIRAAGQDFQMTFDHLTSFKPLNKYQI